MLLDISFHGIGLSSPDDSMALVQSAPIYQQWEAAFTAEESTQPLVRIVVVQTCLYNIWTTQWGLPPPEHIFGHSIGELAALYAADMYRIEDVIVITRCLYDTMQKHRGWMCAYTCDENATDTMFHHMICDKSCAPYIASRNSETQYTLCAAEQDVTFSQFLQQCPEEVKPRLRKVRTEYAWHHPTITPVVPFPAIDILPIRSGCTLFLSSGRSIAEIGTISYWTHWLNSSVSLQQFPICEGDRTILELGCHATLSHFYPKVESFSLLSRGVCSVAGALYQRHKFVPLMAEYICVQIARHENLPLASPNARWFMDGISVSDLFLSHMFLVQPMFG